GGTAAGGAGGGVPKCTPGDSKSCAGPGACVGYQVCAGDGTYGACNCGTGGAGGGAGAGGAGGDFVPADGHAGAGWDSISVTGFVGCVTKGGATSCWGDNRQNAFGTGTADAQPVLTPVPAVSGLTVRQILAGVCAVTTADELYCWGGAAAGLYM